MFVTFLGSSEFGYDQPADSDNLVHGLSIILDAGDWWIFRCTFLLLEAPIKQTMEGFLGWVMGVMSDLLTWVIGDWALVRSEVARESPLQVMDFTSVLMRFF